MVKPKGGRGKKAPYDTVVIRIPKDLENHVDYLSGRYRESVLSGREFEGAMTLKTLEEAKDKARGILKRKKSASISLAMLIEELFGVSIDPKELRS